METLRALVSIGPGVLACCQSFPLRLIPKQVERETLGPRLGGADREPLEAVSRSARPGARQIEK